MWEAMHGKMAGFYEARTRGPDRRLYRLFCILEREAPGLDGPSVIVIGGLSKPNNTRFADADYDETVASATSIVGDPLAASSERVPARDARGGRSYYHSRAAPFEPATERTTARPGA